MIIAVHTRAYQEAKASEAKNHSASLVNVFANTLNANTTPTEIGFWDSESLSQCHPEKGYSASASGLVVPESGVYSVSGLIYYEATDAFVCIAIEPALDGEPMGARVVGQFIRNRKGLNEASCSFGGYRVAIEEGSRVSVNRMRLAKPGTVKALAAKSYLNVARLK